jgi:exopolyphosphatase / guanosine-5'-triphosphate,3'-diphosphate pyrophosphatase
VSRRAERLAAIDVGSNTILLLIADYEPSRGLTIVDQAEEQPRLGAGLEATGRLSESAMARALESLTRMQDRCHSRGVGRVAAVATAAIRDARNGEEFADRVRSLGIPLRIISPEEEAALVYRSSAHHFPATGRMLVVDIGGGSLELVGAVSNRVELTKSLPLGAVRLTELGLSTAGLRREIRDRLGPPVVWAEWSGARVIGSGGTFVTLASMVLARHGAGPGESVHGTSVERPELEQLLDELDRMSPTERRQVPGVRPERADIIVAGLAVAAELLDTLGASHVRVSGFGLREGLLLEMTGG